MAERHGRGMTTGVDTVFGFLEGSSFRNHIWWGGFTILIGIIGLSGWIMGSRFIVTIIPKSIAMAPVSAFLFIILGICICISKSAESNPDYAIMLDILLIPSILIGIWGLYDVLSGFPAPISWNVYSDYQIFLVAPESQMSLMSAVLFPSLSTGVFLCRYVTRHGSFIFTAIMACCAVFIIGYCLGHPFFYGGTMKPISFLSAWGFFVCGTGFWFSMSREKP